MQTMQDLRPQVVEREGPLDRIAMPRPTSTGTTIVGLVCKSAGCVVLGADTRATSGHIIADKNCEKIHFIAPNIYCCGAGTAADTENVTQLISSQLKLLRLSSGRESRVDVACVRLKRHLFPYRGHVSAALILGGVDYKGPHLYQIYPHGSTDSLDYVTMGSGSLAAMSVFETGYRAEMTLEEAKTLVHDAVCAGIFNDEGSGSFVDLCVISKGVPLYCGPAAGCSPCCRAMRWCSCGFCSACLQATWTACATWIDLHLARTRGHTLSR